jgi:tRNA dimethylallyltransferase
MPGDSPLLTIVGPTAVGKTTLAIELARRINGEIIGLDSRQIYRGMAIGTAQPTPEQQARVKHHLVGFRAPDTPVSAGEMAKLVKAKVNAIRARDKEPIICGGAGLYYRAITHGIFPGSVSNLAVRERLNREYDELGAESLLLRLQQVDPDYAAIVHPNNRKRLVRALEIYETTGKAPSEHFREQQGRKEPFLNLFTVLVTMDRERLDARIRERTAAMLAQGWVEEVRRLREAHPGRALPPLDSIGYRQIMAYLDGKQSRDEMVAEINLKTRQYARRQLQWFRKEPVDLTIEMPAEPDYSALCGSILRAWKARCEL